MNMPADLSMKGWPRTLVECVEVLTVAFQRKGKPPGEALAYAQDAMLALADYFGGRQFYIPNGACLRAYARNREIVEAVNRSGNVQQVAREFGVSVTRVYQIVNAARVAHRETPH